MPVSTVITGTRGEALAVQYLLSIPFQILGMNVRVGPHDEIDVVAFDPEDRVMVFVEVKTRSRQDEDYRPDLDLTTRKRRALWRAARAWMAERGSDDGYRIDVVCVANGQMSAHIRGINPVV